MKQSRVENENEIRKRQEEIVTLKTTIKNQGKFIITYLWQPTFLQLQKQKYIFMLKFYILGQAYAELKASTSEVASDIANMGAQSTGGIIGEKLCDLSYRISCYETLDLDKTISINFMFDLCDIIADKVNRIQELEDEVQELGLSFGELSHQLAVARSEANSTLHSLNAKIKELEDVKDNAQVESQMANHKHKQVII